MANLIVPSQGRFTVNASEYLLLDSDVLKGGGTDQSCEVQAILDMAQARGGLRLAMDGAASKIGALSVDGVIANGIGGVLELEGEA